MRHSWFSTACAVAVCAVTLLLPSRLPAVERHHPWLFLTAADIQRARDGAAHNPVFATLARGLAEKAATNRVEDLPPLERQWWDAAKKQPWSETYPPIFHHTWLVPYKWADLARTCAQANLLSPSAPLLAKAKRTLLSLSDCSR